MKMKKVAFLAYTDYGNVMTNWSHAINKYSSKYTSKIICVIPHKFSYEIQHDIDLSSSNLGGNIIIDEKNKKEAMEWLLQSDHIVFAEEMSLLNFPRRYKTMQVFQQIFGFHLLELKASKPSLKLYIQHCGMDYRSGHKQFDEINEQYFDRILMGVDLYRLTPKTSKYCVSVASYQTPLSLNNSIEMIKQKFSGTSLKVFHAPSSYSTKGTEEIRKVVSATFNKLPSNSQFEITYEESVPPVPNSQIINSKIKSHIYIDQFHAEIGGYGISSIEALACGNIVFSSIHKLETDAIELQFLTKEKVERFPIIDTSMDLELFQKKLLKVLVTPMDQLKSEAINSFEFYNETYTYKALSHRFEEHVFIEDNDLS